MIDPTDGGRWSGIRSKIARLSVDDRLDLIHHIWETIGPDSTGHKPAAGWLDHPEEDPTEVSRVWFEVEQIATDDRIELAMSVWDSISEEIVRRPIPEWQQIELKRRIQEHEESPGETIPWEEIRDRLLNRFGPDR